MAQEQINVGKCYHRTKIPQPDRLNGEGRVQYVCVPTHDVAKIKIEQILVYISKR